MLEKIIVLTDIHIMPDGGTIIGIDPTARLDAAIDHIKSTSPDADFLVFTGDLTNYGDTASYATFRKALARLDIPYQLLIGNHDNRENFQAEFPQSARDKYGFVQFAQDIGDWRLIGLDSLNSPRLGETRKGAGHLCDQRLEFLEEALIGAGSRRVIVFLHHPPFTSNFAGMDAIKLINAETFISMLKRHENVQLVVSGHIHRTMSANINGIPQALFKSTVHQMPLDFDSQDSSIACVEPPAYGILLLTGEGVVVHTEDYMWPHVDGKIVIA
jgi:3',5'-cyclic-AMP phosphodiesterase